MAELPKHYDLGDALARINDLGELTIVQMDNPMGMVKLRKPETDRLIECLVAAKLVSAEAAASGDGAAIVADLQEQLRQAYADNDLAQAEIARLTADKPKRGRPKKEADAPPVEWEAVPAEPASDQGAQNDHLAGFAVGDWVEVIATKAIASVDRLFADNPRKVQVLVGGTWPKVFDVTELRLASGPNHSDLQGSELDVPELVAGLEAVGLTVLTEVPEVIVTEMDPVKLRQALYEDSKLYGYTPDEMRALIAEVVGEPKTSKELDAKQLGAVLRTMHERGVQSRMPY